MKFTFSNSILWLKRLKFKCRRHFFFLKIGSVLILLGALAYGLSLTALHLTFCFGGGVDIGGGGPGVVVRWCPKWCSGAAKSDSSRHLTD